MAGPGEAGGAQKLADIALGSEDPVFRPSALRAVAASGDADTARWVLDGFKDARLRPSERLSMIAGILVTPETREIGYTGSRRISTRCSMARRHLPRRAAALDAGRILLGRSGEGIRGPAPPLRRPQRRAGTGTHHRAGPRLRRAQGRARRGTVRGGGEDQVSRNAVSITHRISAPVRRLSISKL
jgi:hypothetical protein